MKFAHSLLPFAVVALSTGKVSDKLPSLPGNVVTVSAGNYYFRAPETIPAGLTSFQLSSADSGHVMVVARIGKGHTSRDALALAASDKPLPNWITPLGGPIATGPKSGNATLSLDAGEYVLFCYFHLGDKPHSALGMVRPLHVVARNGVAAATPSPDVVVRLVDYRIIPSHPITAGTHVVRFENAGREPHEIIIMRVGKGPAESRLVGGTGMLAPHHSVISTISFAPGPHEWYCFLSSPGGKDHTALGMDQRFSVAAR